MQSSNNSLLPTILLLLALFLTGVFSGIILLDSFTEKRESEASNYKQVIYDNTFSEAENIADDYYPDVTDKQYPDDEHAASLFAEASESDNGIIELTKRVQWLEEQLAALTTQVSTGKHQAITPAKAKPVVKNFQLYTVERLVRGGIDESLAMEIVRQQNETELKRLELQDRAKRENYYMTDQYQHELAEIEAGLLSLREQIGDDEYDLYLYNSRINNRVKAISVMLGSAAEQAGIQNGDIILDYDGRRIFEWSELKAATTEGERGEYVSVNVLRDGELFSLTIPRGPLGIRLGASRVEP